MHALKACTGVPIHFIHDSGSEIHITNTDALFVPNTKRKNNTTIFGVNDTSVNSECVGDILYKITDTCTLRLRNVHYVPNISLGEKTLATLVSTKRLTSENDLGIEFNAGGNKVTFRDSWGEKVGEFNTLNTLYTHKRIYMRENERPTAILHGDDSKHTEDNRTDTRQCITYATRLTAQRSLQLSQLWHKRIHHSNRGVVGKALERELGITHTEQQCEHCLSSKAKYAKRPDVSKRKAKRVGERLHFDLFSFAHAPSRRYKYLLVIVDEYSQFVWTHILRHKHEVYASITAQILQINRHMQKRVAEVLPGAALVGTVNPYELDYIGVAGVRCDNAGENVNAKFQAFCKKQGIRLETSVAHHPHQNGMAERTGALIIEGALALQRAGQMRQTEWIYCTAAQAHIRNRLPTTRNPDTTPYNLFHGVQLTLREQIQHFRILGSKCYRITPLMQRKGKNTRVEPCVFLGYLDELSGTKGYLLRSLLDGRLLQATHSQVRFDENTLVGTITRKDYRVPSYREGLDENEEENDSDSSQSEEESDEENVFTVLDEPQHPQITNNAPSPHPVPVENLDIEEGCSYSDIEEDNSALSETSSGEEEEFVPRRSSRLRPPSQRARDFYESYVARGGHVDKVNHNTRANTTTYSRNKIERTNKYMKYRAKKMTKRYNSFITKVLDDIYVENATQSTEMLEHIVLLGTQGKDRTYIRNMTRKQMLLLHDSDEYIKAELAELGQFETHKVWELVPRPKQNKPIQVRWTYDLKTDTEGKVVKYKARLVARGFQEEAKVEEIFAPTMKYDTFRTMLTIAAKKKLKVKQYDVSTAFLHAPLLGEEVYVEQPPGHEIKGKEDWVYKLDKAMYGLRSSPRAYADFFMGSLGDLGFEQSKQDDCLFMLKKGTDFLYYLFHVDDICVVSNNTTLEQEVLQELTKTVKIKDMGELDTFLGVKVRRDDTYNYYLSQSHYIKTLVERFQLQSSTTQVDTPSLSTKHLVAAALPVGVEERAEVLALKYQALVGGLIYTVRTRPDVAYAVSDLARFMHSWDTTHWKAGIRCLRYLQNTQTYEHKIYSATTNEAMIITCFADANYSDPRTDDMNPCDDNKYKSQGGHMIYIDNTLVSWKSKRMNIRTHSSMESEYYEANEAAKSVLWFRRLLEELDYSQTQPTVIYEDNTACISFSKNNTDHARTKHIDQRAYCLRDWVRAKLITLKHISTDLQIADILTKALPRTQFLRLLSLIQSPLQREYMKSHEIKTKKAHCNCAVHWTSDIIVG